MVRAGEAAGADLVVFETMTDLAEVRAAVLAAREQSEKKLPIWVTMSLRPPAALTGTTVACMACTLSALGVDAMGINCSLGPKEILPLIREMGEWTAKPLIVKPNAGLPDPATGQYDMDRRSLPGRWKPLQPWGCISWGMLRHHPGLHPRPGGPGARRAGRAARPRQGCAPPVT